MKNVQIGDEVVIRIGHNALAAKVLEVWATGSMRVRLASGSEIWTKSIVEVVTRRTGEGLLDIALGLLAESGPRTAGELAREILSRGLWQPTRAGKTPRLTLYGMLYNEATQRAFPRVRRLDGGVWEAL